MTTRASIKGDQVLFGSGRERDESRAPRRRFPLSGAVRGGIANPDRGSRHDGR
jgi:hypothetical protein